MTDPRILKAERRGGPGICGGHEDEHLTLYERIDRQPMPLSKIRRLIEEREAENVM